MSNYSLEQLSIVEADFARRQEAMAAATDYETAVTFGLTLCRELLKSREKQASQARWFLTGLAVSLRKGASESIEASGVRRFSSGEVLAVHPDHIDPSPEESDRATTLFSGVARLAESSGNAEAFDRGKTAAHQVAKRLHPSASMGLARGIGDELFQELS